MASAVRELELDLDAFEGPFDLLLTLLLKEAIEPAEIDMAGIVVAFVERLAERDELDLDACGEFLVLIAGAARAEGARALPRRGGRARRARARGGRRGARAAARRVPPHEGGGRLAARAARRRGRPLLPPRAGAACAEPERRLAQQEPLGWSRRCGSWRSSRRTSRSRTHGACASRPCRSSSSASAPLLLRRRRFDFDTEVAGLSRVEQAVAFLALLELRKEGEIAISQAAPFAPISPVRRRKDAAVETARSA